MYICESDTLCLDEKWHRGVMIDSRLTFHIHNTVSRIRRT